MPATISPFVIAKIGHGHARALFTTGEMFRTVHAFRIGLVHEIVESSVIDEAVEKKLKAILAAGPKAVAEAKRLAQHPPLSPEEAAHLLASVRAGDEAKEGEPHAVSRSRHKTILTALQKKFPCQLPRQPTLQYMA